MDAGGSLCGCVIEAIECLAALCGWQTRPNEELARSNGKRLRQLGEEGRIELPGSVEQQAAIQGQR